jgi:hypothetical protein
VLITNLSNVSDWFQEIKSTGNGITTHGAWRNYYDFNEFFWYGLWTLLPIVTLAQFSTENVYVRSF